MRIEVSIKIGFPASPGFKYSIYILLATDKGLPFWNPILFKVFKKD